MLSTLSARPGLSRRRFVSSLLAGGAALAATPAIEAAPPAIKAIAPKDSLLDELERRACLYFREAADPKTGLVLDRARAQGRETRSIASIAATGFGLSAMCVGAERGYIARQAAKAQVQRTL